MTTSQKPIIINQISGEPKGSQITVAFSKPSAEERPNGFRIPNQINITPNDKRMAGMLVLLIKFISPLSYLLRFFFMIMFKIQ
jgi:hypothetical protein